MERTLSDHRSLGGTYQVNVIAGRERQLVEVRDDSEDRKCSGVSAIDRVSSCRPALGCVDRRHEAVQYGPVELSDARQRSIEGTAQRSRDPFPVPDESDTKDG